MLEIQSPGSKQYPDIHFAFLIKNRLFSAIKTVYKVNPISTKFDIYLHIEK